MTRRQLKEKYKNVHYVYLHIDPITNQVVYIGKGCRDRAWQICNRSPRHKKWANDLKLLGFKPIIKLLHIFDNAESAFTREVMLISFFRKIGVKLFNKMPGGQVVPSGKDHHSYGKHLTPETKLKLSMANNGRPRPENSEHMKKRMMGNTLRKGKKQPIEAVESMRLKLMGNQNRSIKILCLNNNKMYSSVKQAWTELKLDERSIFRVLKGEWKHTKGYRFKYL